MTLTELLKDLESQAEKATPKKWDWNGSRAVWTYSGKEDLDAPFIATTSHRYSDDESDNPSENARYIATANPANILALLRYVKGLEECLEEACDLMEDVRTGHYKPDTFTLQPWKEALALRGEEVK